MNSAVKVTFLAVFVIGFAWAWSDRPEGLTCRVENGVYLVKEPGDIERAIMLPGTKLGLTVQQVEVVDGKVKAVGEPHTSKGSEGHPTRLNEVDQDYIQTKIVRWQRVEDGNYVVERTSPTFDSPMWTVWTKELFVCKQQRK